MLSITYVYVLQTMHTFKQVFGADSSQTSVFDRIGVPLVEDLLSGKNGSYLPLITYTS